ncbi:MAG: endonuclease [Bacteroidales bacterium]
MMKSITFSYPGLLIFLLTAIAFNTPSAFGQQGSISLSQSQLPDFREVVTGHFSDVQFYEVSAQGISGSLELSAEPPFRISRECHTGYAASLTLNSSQGEVSSTRIYVRMFPESTGNNQGVITHQATDLQPVTLAVSGTGIESLIPDNYYPADTDTGSQLKTQLHQIISGHQVQSYTSIWTHILSTDATFSGAVWDIYSDIPCDVPPYSFTFGDDQDRGSGGSQEGQYYNREHTMPQSWFDKASPMVTDLFHIYPTDKLVNSKRGNEPYGVVSNASWTSLNGSKLGANTAGSYSGTAFEPIDEYKGDLARVYFYMITRYEDRIETWNSNSTMLDHNKYPGYEPWAIDMLMAWHDQDPVSQKEILRNHEIYQIQGNRNPYVDHPEYVEAIWGNPNVSAGGLPPNAALKIFPNPVTDHVKLESSIEILKLEVVSISGKRMRVFYPQATSATFSARSLAPGLYFVVIHTSEGIFRKKMIKQ